MEPPRQRRPRVGLSIARTARGGAVNVGAVCLTLLLVRSAILATGTADRTDSARLIETASYPIAWPFHQIPGFGRTIVSSLTAADVVAVLTFGLLILMLVGIIAGWEAEGRA